ncbi:hypothetical protein AGMMS50256_36990 [Betaproteobacteria bacterium]|nr:hypothetical protein AGMMS50256_36990 [Betaproteobacteria bacterium]
MFAVKQANGTFTITGVTNADNVQNTSLGWLRDQNKISVFLPIDGKVHALAEGTVLEFYVPEVNRNEKPVFIDRTPHKAFIRGGGRNDTCTRDELLRFMRDSANIRFDAEPLDIGTIRCFDDASVRWYRARFIRDAAETMQAFCASGVFWLNTATCCVRRERASSFWERTSMSEKCCRAWW